MDYIRFGSGEKHLVILPGLGDGLQTVKGTAIPMTLMYRIFARDYTVWAFSRKNALPVGSTTRDMARDQAQAMEKLGIAQADVFGVSMGGMIAQHLAVDYPEKVGKLVPIMGKLTKPKSYDRFLIQADAYLHHDAFEKLPLIRAKTLVIGGEKDLALGGDASREIAARIPGAQLRMYHKWGHGVYEEAKDFNRTVLDFLFENE